MSEKQARDVLPNSPANPLPTAFLVPKIPLPAGSANRNQITDMNYIFVVERRFAGRRNAFFPAVREKPTDIYKCRPAAQARDHPTSPSR